MPLGLHISTARVQAGRGWDRELDAFGFSNLMLDNADFWVRVSLTEMILSGVFERYPDLRVGVAEHELNWVPYWIERMDYSYSERAAGREGFRLKNNMAPSDVFHSNCFVDFQEDALGITHRDIIGVDNIMWGIRLSPHRGHVSQVPGVHRDHAGGLHAGREREDSSGERGADLQGLAGLSAYTGRARGRGVPHPFRSRDPSTPLRANGIPHPRMGRKYGEANR